MQLTRTIYYQKKRYLFRIQKISAMISINLTQFFKTGLLAGLFLFCSFAALAQETKVPASPPATATGKIGNADVTVKYSSPSVKGRKVWGELVPYGQVWRTGANEATTITFSKDVTVEGQPLKAGTYALFTIPTENEWTIVFNKTTKQWGAFKYQQAEDALRVKVKPTKSGAMNERMKIDVTPKGKNAGLVTIMWENVAVPFNVKTTAGV
ncbi:MAG: hypothetical protein JWQ14_271 [Adhaeribacter sp.]|jgi:hypothetical protein|nr:hypothetical protein [Adhaeribacter sp.]